MVADRRNDSAKGRMVGDDSDGLDTRTRRKIAEQDVLVGQLLEAVRGLRRDSEAQTAAVEKIAQKVEEYSIAQTDAIKQIAQKVEQFERLVNNGRWLLIGMGLASLLTLMGTGMLASKVVEFFWPK